MKFGIHIGHMGGPFGEMRKLWKFADAKGFDWFSVSDHFQESPYGADAKGAARADEVFRGHWGDSPDRADRTGYLRGTVAEFRALGCTRLSIALREGPYDWEALEAFAAEIVRPN